MAFNKNAKQWFNTYPHAEGLTRELIIAHYEKLEGDNFESITVCQEDHAPVADDKYIGIHFHLYNAMKERKHIRNCRYFDIPREEAYWKDDPDNPGTLLKAYHPHIEAVKSKPAVVRYVTKYDIEYIDKGWDTAAYLESVVTKKGYGFEKAANDIKEGKTMDDLYDKNAGFVMNNKRKIEDFIQLDRQMKKKKKYDPFPGLPLPNPELHPERNEQARFINAKMRGQMKGKSAWFYGQTQVGKSTTLLGDPEKPEIKSVADYFKVYKWNTLEDKQHKSILDCDVIVIDEFKGQLKISELQQLLDQFPGHQVAIKGGDATELPKKVPVFITAQHTPRHVYHKVDETSIAALERRLHQIALVEQYIILPENF